MTKRSKKDFSPHISEKHAPRCEQAGCTEAGLYKAPRMRDSLREYRYFCLEHIREHNATWDYFSGMTSEQIEAFMQDAVTGHRPTWTRETVLSGSHERLQAALNDFLNTGIKKRKSTPKLPTKLQRAVALFELEYPYTLVVLKRTYKQLVKLYHPDHNQGDKLAEEKFKAVANAYKVLEAHLDE